MLEKIAILIIGSALTGIGVVALRWLKKEGVSEDLSRRKQAADLVAHMRSIGVRMEEVDAVLGTLGRSRGDKIGRRPQTLIAVDPEEAREVAAIENADSQREMNELQWNRAERLNRRMLAAFKELLLQMEEEEAHQLQAEQDAWLHYRDMHTEFAGSTWEGGSRQPIMRWGAYSHLTKASRATREPTLSLRGLSQDRAASARLPPQKK